MSAETIVRPIDDSFFRQLVKIHEENMLRKKNLIKEIKVPAFRIKEFEQEMKNAGGFVEHDSFPFGLLIGVPVIIESGFDILFINNLALIYWENGRVGRIESRKPITTYEQFREAVRDMEAFQCQTSKMRVSAFSTGSKDMLMNPRIPQTKKFNIL